MDLADGHFAEDFEDLAADSSNSDDEDSGVEEWRGVSIDEFEEFVRERDWIFHSGL